MEMAVEAFPRRFPAPSAHFQHASSPPGGAQVHIEMADEAGVRYVDEFSLSFHVTFYRLLKWLIALPFTIMACCLLTVSSAGRVQLKMLPT